MYALGARDVFLALVKHTEEHKRVISSSVAISDIIYHYVLSPGEPAMPDMRNVWPAVLRPASRPNVTSVGGIRSSFVFRPCDDDVLAVRELSNCCEHCLAGRWDQCKNDDASRYIPMQ